MKLAWKELSRTQKWVAAGVAIGAACAVLAGALIGRKRKQRAKASSEDRQ